MHTAARDYYPPGDLRVSDADRDLALSELADALEVGRITSDEFDQRSAQVLRARTGRELTDPLADLPLAEHLYAERAPAIRATALDQAQRSPANRIAIVATVAASCFAAAAAAAALRQGPTLQQRELLQQMLARRGVPIPVPPAPGFDWAGTVTPGVIAVLLVVLAVVLSVTHGGSRRLP